MAEFKASHKSRRVTKLIMAREHTMVLYPSMAFPSCCKALTPRRPALSRVARHALLRCRGNGKCGCSAPGPLRGVTPDRAMSSSCPDRARRGSKCVRRGRMRASNAKVSLRASICTRPQMFCSIRVKGRLHGPPCHQAAAVLIRARGRGDPRVAALGSAGYRLSLARCSLRNLATLGAMMIWQ